jgi:hypothetical protein
MCSCPGKHPDAEKKFKGVEKIRDADPGFAFAAAINIECKPDLHIASIKGSPLPVCR